MLLMLLLTFVRTAHDRSGSGGPPTPLGPEFVLTGEIQDFTPEDNQDFFAYHADEDDHGIVANLLGPDGLPG
jgi:hypothetical protein